MMRKQRRLAGIQAYGCLLCLFSACIRRTQRLSCSLDRDPPGLPPAFPFPRRPPPAGLLRRLRGPQPGLPRPDGRGAAVEPRAGAGGHRQAHAMWVRGREGGEGRGAGAGEGPGPRGAELGSRSGGRWPLAGDTARSAAGHWAVCCNLSLCCRSSGAGSRRTMSRWFSVPSSFALVSQFHSLMILLLIAACGFLFLRCRVHGPGGGVRAGGLLEGAGCQGGGGNASHTNVKTGDQGAVGAQAGVWQGSDSAHCKPRLWFASQEVRHGTG